MIWFFAIFFVFDFSTERNTTTNSESNAVSDQVNHGNKEKSGTDNGKQSSSSSSLGKRRKSTKSKKSHHSQQQLQHGVDPNINYKNLDEWLENSIKGMSVNDPSNFNGSPIHGTSSAFTVNNNNPFINSHQHHPLFNPMLPPYMARPYELVSYVIIRSCCL